MGPEQSPEGVNHEFTNAETNATERKLETVISYIVLQENPAHISTDTEPRIHNIITQVIVAEEIRRRFLNIQKTSLQLYESFHKERFI